MEVIIQKEPRAEVSNDKEKGLANYPSESQPSCELGSHTAEVSTSFLLLLS